MQYIKNYLHGQYYPNHQDWWSIWYNLIIYFFYYYRIDKKK